jgi:hypothetical protein
VSGIAANLSSNTNNRDHPSGMVDMVFVLRWIGIALAPEGKYVTQLLQSVLNECSSVEIDVGFSNGEQLISIKLNTGGKNHGRRS